MTNTATLVHTIENSPWAKYMKGLDEGLITFGESTRDLLTTLTPALVQEASLTRDEVDGETLTLDMD